MTLQRRHLLASLAATPFVPSAALAQVSSPGLIAAARAEGRVVSVGMPDDWANWRATWADLQRLYGIAHVDTDMSSAEQIAKIEAERANASVDIGDVGFEFGAIAKARGITRAYKTSHWAQIPDWAKDADGHWMLAYTGTIAFAVNRRLLKEVPRSWKALFAMQPRLSIGAVGRAAQANAAVLACAHALGGSETQLKPALQALAGLQRAGKLLAVDASPALMERAEAEVFLLWDFNALNYRDKLPNAADYEVLIPADGSISSGYTTLLNKHSKRPNAGNLAREYILSDAGQLNLARGRARPIRVDHLSLPADVQAQLLPSVQSRAARALKPALWTDEVKKLPRAWQREVLG